LRSRIRWWIAFATSVREIRKRRYDLLIELRGDVRHIVSFGCLGGAGRIVTYERNGGHFLADLALEVRGERHEILQGTDLIEALGGEAVTAIPSLHGPEESARIERLLAQFGVVPGDVLVIVHPGAKKVNQWPLANYAQMVTRLLANPAVSVRIVVTGSASEAALAQPLVDIDPARVLSLSGRVSMLELAALVSRADLFVGADTGPMHLINACKTPALLFFGPTQPRRFAPLSGEPVIVRGRDCCAKSLHETCIEQPHAPYSACMQSIGVETALAAIAPLMERVARTRIAPTT
jgi:ADP-heptose:LPS heptosyltransferase